MKAILIENNKKPNASFAIREHKGAFFDYPMHFHPQYELTYIAKGKGTRFVGNSIDSFDDGDLVLLGQNLPHCWRNNPEYYTGDHTYGVHCIVIQFSHDFLGSQFFEIPENFRIKELLQRAARGLSINAPCSEHVIDRLKDLIAAKETRQIIILIEILYELSKDLSMQPISSGSIVQVKEKERDRINKVISYVSEHFQYEISLDTVADLVNMNRSSFCKFFKKNTKRTFIEFVNEVRIGFACQKLREGQQSITEICYSSGYFNFSNFSRMFKKFTSLTPSEYISAFQSGKKSVS